jgi:hypothetical protein
VPKNCRQQSHAIARDECTNHTTSTRASILSRSFGDTPSQLQLTVPTTGYERELFEYTSGRWMQVPPFSTALTSGTNHHFRYNEKLRLEERRLPLNIEELKKAAAKSVDRSTSDITRLRKLAEGGFNRVLKITFKDGFSVLARLPYPSTIPRRLAVASEVVTMDLVRMHSVPTPKIYTYSADDNPVRSEYILIEKLSGRPLSNI